MVLGKICTVFYGDSPHPEHTSRRTWSHKDVVFKENPGKKLRQHGKSKSNERIKKYDDIVLYADESMTAARKEMLGIFLAIFDKTEKKFKIEYVTLIEVSSTKPEIVMHAIEKTLI